MTRLFVDIHVLQTVPPSNINRDDTGSPKTAIYGGIRRARVSSQAWKRATRVAFADRLDAASLGVRTKRAVHLVADAIAETSPALEEQAVQLATDALTAAGLKIMPAKKDKAAPGEVGYLVFLSRAQIRNLAAAAISAATVDDPAKAMRAARVKQHADTDHSIDIALFGRMVADQKDLSVDAAAQVAHAISVHPAETEFDYFTAVDDQNTEEESGAGMIGTVEFNSSTLYRYATVNVAQLLGNLGDPTATTRAVEAFVDCFVRSMPTGKQNTFGNRTLPEAVAVLVRDTQPISLVGAFETPVREVASEGRVKRAAEALRGEALETQRAYGEVPLAGWVTRVGSDTEALDDLGTNLPLPELVRAVGELVGSRISS